MACAAEGAPIPCSFCFAQIRIVRPAAPFDLPEYSGALRLRLRGCGLKLELAATKRPATLEPALARALLASTQLAALCDHWRRRGRRLSAAGAQPSRYSSGGPFAVAPSLQPVIKLSPREGRVRRATDVGDR